MRISILLSKAVFAALIGLIVLTAIPYGTIEPWWKAAFVCAVFAICIVAIVESLVSGSSRIEGRSILLSMLALSAFAFVQTISISADQFQTRFFALQILALTVFLALLYRYVNTRRRVRLLVYTILGVAVVSAIFGLFRQTTQQETGFVLPLLKQNQGFAQFVNKNHFAYLMEMAFGLGLGILVGRKVIGSSRMIHIALLFPIWLAFILANSRGGILAMLVQVFVAALLMLSVPDSGIARSSVLRAALVVLLVAGVLVSTVWVGGERLASSFEATTREFSQDASRDGVSRNEIWRASLKMFAAQPILGVGLGGYGIGITAYHDASGRMTPQEAHNDYLELLSSGGLIGLALGVWFVVAVVRKVRENLSVADEFERAVRYGAVLGLAGVAAHSLVDFGLHIMINAVVFLALIVMATARFEPQSQ